MLGVFLDCSFFFFLNSVIWIKFKAFLPLSYNPGLFILGDRLLLNLEFGKTGRSQGSLCVHLPSAVNIGMCHHTQHLTGLLGIQIRVSCLHCRGRRPSPVDV